MNGRDTHFYAFAEPVGHWHRWFAWHPVKTWDGRKVWLKWIERRLLTTKPNLDPPYSSWFEYHHNKGYIDE